MYNNYEYMLHTWGGFYNKEFQEKHGYKSGYFWFDTEEEREAYILKLKEAEEKYNARVLAISRVEGTHTRFKTIGMIIFTYQGKEYPYEHDFGYMFPFDWAEREFTGGYYSFDSSRRELLAKIYPEFKDSSGDGGEIEMKSFRLVISKICSCSPPWLPIGGVGCELCGGRVISSGGDGH
jgi:hypothetical protein